MCTLTWLRQEGGYLLLFNRDELRERGAEREPVVHTRGARRFIAPGDSDHGGTWLSVSDGGVTVCVLNGYQASDADAGERRSRGLLVLDLADSRTRDEALERLRADDPSRYRSFLLLAIDAHSPPALGSWDGRRFTLRTDVDGQQPVISAAIRSERVRASRQATFDALRTAHGGVDESMLRAYHTSHREGPSPRSPCMHHERAETRSHSVVQVTESRVKFEHTPGAPCRTTQSSCTVLSRVTPNSLLKNPSAPGHGPDAGRRADVPLRPGTPSAALRGLDVASAATSPAQHDGRRTWTKPGTAGVSQQAANSLDVESPQS